MSFKQDLQPYFDGDNLVANDINPTPDSGGNELLETGTAYVLMKMLGEYTDADATQVTAAVRACQAGGVSGIYDRNPPINGVRRLDNIAFDDIIGVVSMSVICNLPFAAEVVAYAEHTDWWLTNNGTKYWTSWVKPWHKAYYQHSANVDPSWFDETCMDVFFGWHTWFMPDPSGTRLDWLMLESLHISNPEAYDEMRDEWYVKLKSQYGSMKNVFSLLHGPTHPFTVWCPV